MNACRWNRKVMAALTWLLALGCQPSKPAPAPPGGPAGPAFPHTVRPTTSDAIPEPWNSLIAAHEPSLRASNVLKTFDTDTVRRDAIEQFTAGNAMGVYMSGYALYTEKSYREAYQMYRLCLKLNPRFGRAHYGIGRIYYDMTLYDVFRRGLERKTTQGWPIPYADDRAAGLFEGALAEFEKAVELTPAIRSDSDIDMFFEMCKAKLIDYYIRASHDRAGSGRFEDGLALCDKAIRLAPPFSYNATLNKAFCLASLSRYDEAIRTYDEAIRREPKRPEALYGRVTARLRLRGVDTEDQRRLLEALRQEVHNPDLNTRLGALILMIGQKAPGVREEVEQIVATDRALSDAMATLHLGDAGKPSESKSAEK